LFKAIKELSNCKAPEIDGITAEVLKHAGKSMIFLKKLSQKIWDEKAVPSDWSKMLLASIHKKGDKLGAGASCEGSSSGRSPMGEQHGHGRYPTTATKKTRNTRT